MLASVLLSVSWAAAQSNASPATPTESNEAQTQSGAAVDRAMTVEGCLSGSGGNYTLTDAKGATYQLTGDASKLSEHVGHEVKVTGSAKTTPGASETETKSTGAMDKGPATLEVRSVKHVAKSCKSAGSMSK
jgi:hypothetical protein